MPSLLCEWPEVRHAAQVGRPAEMRGSIGGMSKETVPEQTSTYDLVERQAGTVLGHLR